MEEAIEWFESNINEIKRTIDLQINELSFEESELFKKGIEACEINLEELLRERKAATKKKAYYNANFGEVVSVSHTRIAAANVISKSQHYAEELGKGGMYDPHEVDNWERFNRRLFRKVENYVPAWLFDNDID